MYAIFTQNPAILFYRSILSWSIWVNAFPAAFTHIDQIASCWWIQMSSDIGSWLTGADGVLTPAQSILGAIQG